MSSEYADEQLESEVIEWNGKRIIFVFCVKRELCHAVLYLDNGEQISAWAKKEIGQTAPLTKEVLQNNVLRQINDQVVEFGSSSRVLKIEEDFKRSLNREKSIQEECAKLVDNFQLVSMQIKRHDLESSHNYKASK